MSFTYKYIPRPEITYQLHSIDAMLTGTAQHQTGSAVCCLDETHVPDVSDVQNEGASKAPSICACVHYVHLVGAIWFWVHVPVSNCGVIYDA